MPETDWLQRTSPAFRLMIATSWLAPASWRKNQEQAIREAIQAEPDWSEYLRLVDRHGTPAMSWAALGRVARLAIPEVTRQDLQKREHACRVQAIRHCRELERLMKAFNRLGIPVMNLKGPMLSSELYGDVGLRQSKDLDLAVVPEDIERTLTCLKDLGWNLDPILMSMTPRQWEKFHRMNDDLSFFHPERGIGLEVHSRIHWDSPEQNRSRWSRSVPTIWQGCSLRVMNPVDEVLYLCGHGGGHNWFRAKWLGDLARIHTAGLVNWEVAMDLARATGQERPLLACLQLLHIACGLPLPHLNSNPWDGLPPSLIDSPLRALKVAKEPKDRGALESLPDLAHMIRYPRLVLPRMTWRKSLDLLFYCRQDFGMVHLPDSLFWAYALLRPILFAWRKLIPNFATVRRPTAKPG